MNKGMNKHLKTWVFAYLTLAVLALPLSAAPHDVLNWSRGVDFQSNVPGQKAMPFYLLSVGELAGHLFGTCIYLNQKEGPSQDRVTLEVQTDGDELWPLVTLQVANDVKGPWQLIGSSGATGVIIKLKIDSEARSPQLRVDLEAYRSFIEKYRFGQIVLRSGESAIFELADLRRPKEGE
jgi:hypothetical protein